MCFCGSREKMLYWFAREAFWSCTMVLYVILLLFVCFARFFVDIAVVAGNIIADLLAFAYTLTIPNLA